LRRAGLSEFHQVQNGVLLCERCRTVFDTLGLYFDMIGDKYIVNVVNYSKNKRGEKHLEWEKEIEIFRMRRTVWLKYFSGKDVVNAAGS
jgi:hypothetical protein